MLFSCLIDTCTWIQFSTGYQPYRSQKQILDMSLLMIGWRPSGACVGDLFPTQEVTDSVVDTSRAQLPRCRPALLVAAAAPRASPPPPSCRFPQDRLRQDVWCLAQPLRGHPLAGGSTMVGRGGKTPRRAVATGQTRGNRRESTGQCGPPVRPRRGRRGSRRKVRKAWLRRSRGDGEGLGVPPVPGKHRDRASPSFHRAHGGRRRLDRPRVR